MNTYKLEIKNNDFLNILSKYYTQILGHPCNVKEKHEIDYGRYGDKSARINIYYEETIDILGYKATKTTTISKEQVEDIFNELIKSYGLEIDTMLYNSGVRIEGYYCDEYETAYFNGITLSLKERKNNYTKKKELN